MSKKRKITIIIPTKNRSKYLNKFLIKCEKIFKPFDHYYLIIDASDDVSFKKNRIFLSKYKKLKIIKQSSKGIQRGCCEALKYVKTKDVVILYDDDELSRQIRKIYNFNIDNLDKFSFGHGIVLDINKKISFKELESFKIEKNHLLKSYFGSNINKYFNKKNINKNIQLPVSPICGSFKLSILNYWKTMIFRFAKKSSFRNFMLLEKEVGPDLLIYLFSIKKLKIFNFNTPHVAKFSSHKNSISIIYGANFLRIGYWLARVCFFETYEKNKGEVRNYMYTYLIITGIYLLLYNFLKFYYFKNIFYEILTLLFSKNKRFVFGYMYKIIKNKISVNG